MSRVAEALAPQLYGGLPGFKEPTTSRAAAAAVAGEASILRERVFAAIAGAGERGLTADEAAGAVGRDRLSVRPRLTELAHAIPARITPTGERRRNESGLRAKVWRIA